jgi:hypothetical protein
VLTAVAMLWQLRRLRVGPGGCGARALAWHGSTIREKRPTMQRREAGKAERRQRWIADEGSTQGIE